MQNILVSNGRGFVPGSLTVPPTASERFDRTMVLLCSWLILGLYIDGWAHRHHQIETFFTSWHAILYSGLLAVASLVLVMLYKNRSQGYPWRSTMPVGYGLSLVGLLIFVVGGLGDLIWHEIFGFEHDLEALLSPSHLVLAFSGALMVAGPFRAAWHRPDAQSHPSLSTQWPMLVSMTLLLSLFTFFTQFAHPFVETWLMQDTHRAEVYGEIFVMDAGGGGQTRLARHPARSMNHPSWSADGRRIVFALGTWKYNQSAPSDAEIYVMNADGTEQRRLTHNIGYDGHPSWSPDGSKIAFESVRDGTQAIYAMNADGSNQTRLTRGHGRHGLPSWSPDSKTIAFASERDGATEIYAVGVNGDEETRLTTTGENGYPSWSPEGGKLAFASRRDGNWEIYVMDADGRNARRLTDDAGIDRFPAWAPDGNHIAFASNRDDNWEIYKMNAAGGLEINLTNNPAMEDANDARPSWSSDATSIVFAATGHPRYSGFLRRALGIASILVQSALQMGLVLLAVMRWDLRFFSLTLVFTLNAALNVSQAQDYDLRLVVTAALAGLVADTLVRGLKPSAARPQAMHLFAFTVPTIYYALFFLMLMLTRGIGWSAHLWMGSIVLAGFTGWLLSYILLAALRIPQKQEHEG